MVPQLVKCIDRLGEQSIVPSGSCQSVRVSYLIFTLFIFRPRADFQPWSDLHGGAGVCGRPLRTRDAHHGLDPAAVSRKSWQPDPTFHNIKKPKDAWIEVSEQRKFSDGRNCTLGIAF